MSQSDLDAVDRGILHMLQLDARNNTAADIADAVGVAPNTVRNRLERLEDQGIVLGYHPDIDYEAAGYQLRVMFICTVAIADREEIADSVLDIEGVIEVTEALSGHHNLIIEAVGEDSDDVTTIGSQLESLGCTIEDELFLKTARPQPFNHFGAEEATEE